MPVNREKPFGERRCRSCSNYIRALQKGKVWDSFKKKVEEQRTAAYKDRKGKKYQALDVGDMEVSVEENDTRYKNQHAADKYLPFAKWRAQRILEDFSKQAWSDDKWKEEWTKLLDDPDTEKIYQRGQWHIGEYFGIEMLDGHGKQFQTSLKRKRAVENADQLQDLTEEARGMSQKWARQSSSIMPTVQNHKPDVYEPREGEVEMKLQETRFVAAQQHDLSKEAAQAEKD